MLNMIAGSVLPITAFIGVFFAFAATCILTSFLNDWLPRDMGREFAHNGKLSAGKPRGAGIIFISVFCIAALLFGEMSVEMFIYLVLVFVEMLTGFMDDAADAPPRTECDTLPSRRDAHGTGAHRPVKSLLLQRVSPFRKGVRLPAIFLLCVCLPLFTSSFS